MLHWVPDERQAERQYDKPTYSKIGVIARTKNNRLKLCLIHDLRWSGIDARVAVLERVLLPREAGISDDLLWLAQEARHDNWEAVALDFPDAFGQLYVRHDERRHLCGHALHGMIANLTLLFGVKSGPLVWGRVASLAMRLTAVLHLDELVRTECFVDDPFIAAGGNPHMRQRLLLRIVVLWLSLGFRLSWRKGMRGRQHERIGAQISRWLTCKSVQGIEIAITLD